LENTSVKACRIVRRDRMGDPILQVRIVVKGRAEAQKGKKSFYDRLEVLTMANYMRQVQLEEIGGLGETGLSLEDSVMVTFCIDEAGARKIAADPEIRAAHSAGRTRGVAAVMAGLATAAKAGSASAAATLLKAGAIAIEREAQVDYEIEVRHKAANDKMWERVSRSVAEAFKEQRVYLSRMFPHISPTE